MSQQRTHALAVERAWRAAEAAEFALSVGRAAEAKVHVDVSIAWVRVAGQLPALVDPEPCHLFGLDAGPEHEHRGCLWPMVQCTGHAPRSAALDDTAVIPVVRDVEPGQGGDPGLWCYCGRGPSRDPGGHPRTESCT